MNKTAPITELQIRSWLEEVMDPEIPVLSVLDMGIIREIKTNPDTEIIITPTYSGCPALDVISMNIRLKLMEKGLMNVKITQSLSPAWTTDWMTDSGKQKLKSYGIAPPNPKQSVCDPLFHEEEAIECPRCGSYETEVISQFGSTACKALYRCKECLEPFDYFKCH